MSPRRRGVAVKELGTEIGIDAAAERVWEILTDFESFS